MAAKDIEAGRAHVLLSIRDRLTQGLKVAEKRMQRFGRYVATSAAVISGGALGSMLWPVKLASDMQQASVSFEVFTGSAETAKKLMADLQTFAADTPFQFDEVRDAAQLLMGFGATANQVIPMLNMLGDISGGNKERFQRLALAFGQVMAKGRLMGQEVLQMTENGFNPLAEMAKKTGKSMAVLMKEMEAGQISFPMLVSAMQSATGPGGRFHNMMAKISKTLGGLMSTLIDYGKMVAVAFGDTLIPFFESLVKTAIPVAKAITEVIKANAKLVGGVAKAVLVVGAIAGVFLGLGVASMGVSFVLGLVASGLSAVFAIIGTIFSPVGLLIAALAGLAGAAYYFRSAIGEAFQGLMIWLQPVTAAFARIYAVASMAIGGVVQALGSGQIEAAGAIAMAGLKAVFWSAVAEIPGAGRLAATGFGQAILAGRWDLAAAIGMERVKLVLLEQWASITNLWSGQSTGLGAIWDMLVYGIRTGWNVASSAIASGMVWVVGKVQSGIAMLINAFDSLITYAQIAANSVSAFFSGSGDEAAKQNQKLREGLAARTSGRSAVAANSQKAMQDSVAQQKASFQAGIDRDFEQSMVGRVQSEQAAQAARGQGLDAQRQRVSGLEAEAAKAAEDSGIKSLEDKAFRAQMDLAKATDAARAARENGAKLAGNLVPGLGGAGGGLPKVESRGTFSAAAAAAFGNRSNAPEQTARNTGSLVKLTKILVDKPGPQFK